MDKLTEEQKQMIEEFRKLPGYDVNALLRTNVEEFLIKWSDTLLQKEREAGKREAYQNCVDWTKQVQPYNQEAINAHSAAVSQMDWELKS